MKKLKAAVIGLGFIGPQHIDALLRTPAARVEMICGTREDATREVAERYGIEHYTTDWHEIIANPEIDVVHNCTPHALHDEINRAAILAGKHIYSEKPLSNSAANAKEIWKLAEEKGVAHGLNHQYRMNAAVQEMRCRYQNGLTGRPLLVYGRYLQESASAETDWSRKMENTGIARVLNDIGIHWVDTVNAVLGVPVKAVMANLTTHYSVRTDEQGQRHEMTTEDTGMILLRFADGTPGQLLTSKSTCGHKNDLRVAISCENCEMEWFQEQPDHLRIGRKGVGDEDFYMNPKLVQPQVKPYITTPMGHVMGWPDALRNALQIFYASILDGSYRTKEQPYSTFKQGFMGMAFVEACVRSNREQRWVEVEQP